MSIGVVSSTANANLAMLSDPKNLKVTKSRRLSKNFSVWTASYTLISRVKTISCRFLNAVLSRCKPLPFFMKRLRVRVTNVAPTMNAVEKCLIHTRDSFSAFVIPS